MQRAASFWIVVAAVAFGGTANAVAQARLCPDTVKVEQKGAAPPAGWTLSYNEGPASLEGVTFFNGPPQEQASLVYDRWVDGKDTSVATWSLPHDARGYWLLCTYRRTSLELSKRLPDAVTSCQVVYERQVSNAAGLPTVRTVTCK